MYKFAFNQLRRREPQTVEELGELKPALEVWGYIQSQPEPGLAIATIGKRDISYDDMPVPQLWFRPTQSPQMRAPWQSPDGHAVRKLDDQHCYLTIPMDTPLRVGDMVGFGISHPCLTFDKWRVLHKVDDEYNVVGSIRTYF